MSTAPTTLRDAQKALTRTRIIEAAKPVFEREGYAGASIGLIASEAFINRATFYLHFADKSEVFREVVSHDRLALTEYWRELNTVLLVGTRAAVESWVLHLTQWYRDNSQLMPAKHEAMASDPAFAKEFQPRYDRLALEIRGYLDQFPEKQREDEKIRVQMLVVMIDQMYFHAMVQSVWSGGGDQLRRVVTDILCKSLGFN
ncbi:MAG: TetR/AcrR family transcriptional regulator [Leucobacter sp.]